MRFTTSPVRLTLLLIIAASLLVLGVRPLIFRAQAADLLNRSIKISSATAGDTATYLVTFDIQTAGPLGSISIQFCDTSPLEGDPCVPPPGFDASGANLINESGETGFSIDPASTANHIILTRTAQAASTGTVSYEFDSIVNPSNPGSFFARIGTYATEDISGSTTDYGGIALVNNSQVNVSATVPPYLLFCTGVTITGNDCGTASGSYVNFGELSTGVARYSTSQMLLATNAALGYVVSMNGTTMQSGINTIPALTSNDVSRPGTGQFGLNLRDNSDPNVGTNPSGGGAATPTANYNIPNRYRFVSGEQIASAPTADRYKKFTVSYVVNISGAQTPGIYVTTLTYIALATF